MARLGKIMMFTKAFLIWLSLSYFSVKSRWKNLSYHTVMEYCMLVSHTTSTKKSIELCSRNVKKCQMYKGMRIDMSMQSAVEKLCIKVVIRYILFRLLTCCIIDNTLYIEAQTCCKILYNILSLRHNNIVERHNQEGVWANF